MLKKAHWLLMRGFPLRHVIPAKAGIQLAIDAKPVIPAKAGIQLAIDAKTPPLIRAHN